MSAPAVQGVILTIGVQLALASLTAAPTLSPVTLTMNAIVLVVAGLRALETLSSITAGRHPALVTIAWDMPAVTAPGIYRPPNPPGSPNDPSQRQGPELRR